MCSSRVIIVNQMSFRASRSGEESKAVEGFLQNRSTPTHILRSLRSSEPSMPVATGATKDENGFAPVGRKVI